MFVRESGGLQNKPSRLAIQFDDGITLTLLAGPGVWLDVLLLGRLASDERSEPAEVGRKWINEQTYFGSEPSECSLSPSAVVFWCDNMTDTFSKAS